MLTNRSESGSFRNYFFFARSDEIVGLVISFLIISLCPSGFGFVHALVSAGVWPPMGRGT